MSSATPAANLLKRKLALVSTPETGWDALVDILKATDGVESVERNGQRLTVLYNIERLDYRTLCQTISANGGSVAASFGQRLRGSLYQFMDENARSNMHLQGACCSRPPPQYKERR